MPQPLCASLNGFNPRPRAGGDRLRIAPYLARHYADKFANLKRTYKNLSTSKRSGISLNQLKDLVTANYGVSYENGRLAIQRKNHSIRESNTGLSTRLEP